VTCSGTAPAACRTARRIPGGPTRTPIPTHARSPRTPTGAALGRPAPDADQFIVDLTGVKYPDSAGITALLEYLPRLQLIVNPLTEPILTVSGV
jgi:hypothetical protein